MWLRTVASDTPQMHVATRSNLMQLLLPLLSSVLPCYCYSWLHLEMLQGEDSLVCVCIIQSGLDNTKLNILNPW
jgi:hypothetical protein